MRTKGGYEERNRESGEKRNLKEGGKERGGLLVEGGGRERVRKKGTEREERGPVWISFRG